MEIHRMTAMATAMGLLTQQSYVNGELKHF